MPHKRNPITSERVTGLARLLRGYAQAGLENVALWHERDISHSSVERVALPDATTLLHYMQHLMVGVVDGMRVYPDRMRANVELTHGALFSQAVLTALVESGMTRDDAYRSCSATRSGPGTSSARSASCWRPTRTSPAGSTQHGWTSCSTTGGSCGTRRAIIERLRALSG